ncbi:TonB-dependent receptor plug domain-containing protein [Terricaulis sp.]|uniref:TonB-dependent receptor plug domain-containing protein n=1 Tax=Terricaulis sp. TaxID=2768686 RepID=UPI002AC44B46|nr:TonB-dependent receptor [Terricaulis sp.]MDZ4690966.1 TonB-dependent receptor [Terricaulis sp.]
MGDQASRSDELVVTGTRIRGAAPAGANLLTLDRSDIDESGRTNVQDLLQTLPQVFPGSQGELTQLNSTAPGNNIALGSTVDLRGLGADATLTLLNGRRLAPAGLGNFVDISAIPLAAIERVDVLADGASATYGSDAVGGVVNVLLRRTLDRPETTIRYGGADAMNEIGLSHVFGADWANGSMIAGYEYRQRDALAAADRDYASTTDLTRYGGTNFSRITAAPGNIILVGGTPVTLAIPEGQNGLTLTEADLQNGVVNLQNGNEGSLLLPEQESHGLFVSLSHDMNRSVRLFADILASERRAHAEKSQLGGVIAVPETNYYRQQNGLFAGQGDLYLGYFFGDDFGPLMTDTRSRTLASAAGAEFDLGSDWRLEASVSYGAHSDEVDNFNIADSAAIGAALASSDPTIAFNPFGDGGDTPAAALASLTMRQHLETDSELIGYALRADGGVFELPGGRARIAVGIERRHETFRIDRTETTGSGIITTPFTQAPGERTTDAIYAEAFLPVLDRVSLSLSVRREESSDFGDATTPKIGLQWTPFDDLTFRATWGQSFKAPQFAQMLGGTGASIGSLPGFLDPDATNGSTGLLQILGANPNLEPEEANTWTAGFEFAPSWLEGFRLSATYFDIDFSNRIAIPGFILDAFQNPAQYQGYFIRNPTPEQIAAYLALTDDVSGVIPPDGIEVIWDERLTNLAALRVRGVDLAASYAFETPLGEMSLFASASGLLQFARQNNPSLASTDVLDTMLNPVDWRARAGVALDAGAWRGALSLHYTDSYRDTLSTPAREIQSWTTFDGRITRRLNLSEDGAATELTLDIRNLADEDPPFANNPIGMGFDTLNASPVGRVVMVEVRQRW